jgi:hypothetical protein
MKWILAAVLALCATSAYGQYPGACAQQRAFAQRLAMQQQVNALRAQLAWEAALRAQLEYAYYSQFTAQADRDWQRLLRKSKARPGEVREMRTR